MKKRNKDIAKAILKGMAISGMVAGVIVFPGLAHLFKFLDERGRSNRASNRRAYYGLKQRGMIKVKKGPKRIELILTEKGRRRLKEYKLEDTHVLKKSHWDGWWRIVMFDIPETSRNKRDLIRMKLVQEGFLLVQKSVFINPYPCGELVGVLRAHYKLDPGQLYVFKAKVIEGEKDLRKRFSL
jgi:phenylacetic acid degradation operon negative regulatory protein